MLVLTEKISVLMHYGVGALKVRRLVMPQAGV